MLTPKQREEYREDFCAWYVKMSREIDAKVSITQEIDYWLDIIDKREEELVKKIDAMYSKKQKGQVLTLSEEVYGGARNFTLDKVKNIINPNK